VIDALADALVERIAAKLPAAQTRERQADDVLTSREAADYVRLTMQAFYKRTGRGEIAVMDRGGPGNSMRFRRQALDDWLEGVPPR
jgi:excisionase family DNA binding protein